MISGGRGKVRVLVGKYRGMRRRVTSGESGLGVSGIGVINGAVGESAHSTEEYWASAAGRIALAGRLAGVSAGRGREDRRELHTDWKRAATMFSSQSAAHSAHVDSQRMQTLN